MDMRSKIGEIINNNTGRVGELLLDLERLHPDQSDEFWSEIKRLCCTNQSNAQSFALAVLTFANKSLPDEDLNVLIGHVGRNFDKNSDILPYILKLIRLNGRKDKINFCENAYEWGMRVGNKHVCLNAQRCLDLLSKE